MPTARKLPSGSWNCLVYSHREQGKRIYKSFTYEDPSPKGKRICEKMAADWAAEKEAARAGKKTFGSCVQDYIDLRRNTLSPRTIEDYERTKRLYLGDLDGIRMDSLTQQDVQRVIDRNAARLSPKTVLNIHCLISAVVAQERPQMTLRTSLPQRTKPELTIPTDSDVKAILQAVKGTTLELPVMLAAFGPMREGEICALRRENIHGSTVHVCENMIRKMVDGKTTWMIRHPKSAEGNRFIDYPDFVAALWAGSEDRIVNMNPNTLCKSFKRIVDRLGLSGIRFHDLRHWCASTLHAQGVPDAYLLQRAGWSSDRLLKIYRHALDDYQDKMTALANKHFQGIMQDEMQDKKESPL